MSFPFKSYDYAALSLHDLLTARDLYHLHLMNKKNVVATAVGYYRIRKADPWPTPKDPNPDTTKNKSVERTLGNSEVRPYSWPSILVFVEKWEKENDLINKDQSEIVPKTLYLPDGKAVPVCVIKAVRLEKTDDNIDLSKLNFPRNVISGGFPLIMEVQHKKRIASFGCLVSDGHFTYALTNKHVVGKPGQPIKTILRGQEEVVGRSSSLQLGRIPFEKIYPTLKGASVYLNMDIGLVEIDDLNQWKAEVLGIGQLEKLIDLDTNNMTLKLINQKVVGYGAVSNQLFEGEIQALFYRYKSIGGFEYISDFLIGPRTKNIPQHKEDEHKALTVSYGDSGSLILLQLDPTDSQDEEVNETRYYPLGVLWGMHQFVQDGTNQVQPFVLATCLSSVCSLLNVELVRNWNLDQTNTWGSIGHFKIGALACELVTSDYLSQLLMANQKNIGYEDQDLISGNIVGGAFTREFVPLTDVADIIWRTTRPNDEFNHFCDIDETDPSIEGGKSLLELSLADSTHLDMDFWVQFDDQLDVINPTYHKNRRTGEEEFRPRRGGLPFRVWQMYNEMIEFIQQGDLLGFIAAGGTMAHYVGDACQPLHISYLHHGHPGSNETAVHSDYETNFINKKKEVLFEEIKKKSKAVDDKDFIDKQGKSAALLVLKLMKDTVKLLPPEEVISCWAASAGRGKYEKMWDQLGKRTAKNMAEGARVLAILWESAWKHGGGDQQFKKKDLVELDQGALQERYLDQTFVPSFILGDPRFKAACY